MVSLRGQSGFSAVMLLLLICVLGGAGYFFFGPRSASTSAELSDRALFDQAVTSLERALTDPQSISASLDRNAAFQCLFSATGSCTGQGGAFLFYESRQTSRPLSQLARTEGIAPDGNVCRSYPSKACPLRVETTWEPVCGGANCEATRSFHVHAKVTLLGEDGAAPLEWSRETMLSPEIQLSQAVQCARGGGTWSGTECRSGGEAERRIASPEDGRSRDELESEAALQAVRAAEEHQQGPAQAFECPNTIVVQGQYYPVQFLQADRAQVSVPAMSCPQPGHYDTFVFQCARKTPASFPTEGQWIQVEAVLDPPCGEGGQPVPGSQNLPIRF